MNEKINIALGETRTWLVTGCAGFIGSHIIERLLKQGQTVRGIDNFSNGFQANLDDVKLAVGEENYGRFTFFEGDINDDTVLTRAMEGAEVVSHQAALGSVPRSIKEPAAFVRANVEGFMAVAKKAADLGIGRIVYASSSSVYGDNVKLPKVEDEIGSPLSPYAASKLSDELFASACANSYGLEFVGLRYFNVFGPRQDPAGAYAAVIPKWIMILIDGGKPVINGDMTISRDFTYVDNAVDANILGAVAAPAGVCEAYNVGNGEEVTLEGLYNMIADNLLEAGAISQKPSADIGPPRAGDVKNSLADISKARSKLGYDPKIDVREGLLKTTRWFIK